MILKSIWNNEKSAGYTFIWFVNGDNELSSKAKKAIENGENYLSIASVWEIAIKVSLKKLDLYSPFPEIINQISKNNFQLLPISISDITVLTTIPLHHRDPFDRIIIAQSINNGLQLISKDKVFDQYGIQLSW